MTLVTMKGLFLQGTYNMKESKNYYNNKRVEKLKVLIWY